MGTKINFKVNEDYDKKLVKEFLRRKCEVSSTLLRQLKLIDNGITRNGEHIRAVDTVNVGDEIVITLPEEKNDITPVNLPINILYEDEHIIIFDKAPFMAVHPVHGHIDDTLANAAAYYAKTHGELWTFRAINRLDRDTSGTLLAAKNAYAAARLPKTVKKKYIAVCEGTIENGGTVDAPIRLKEGHSIQREVGEGGMSYLGYPLAGDDMYGGSRALINRQALHCGEVSFIHPITNELMRVESQLPKEFTHILLG